MLECVVPRKARSVGRAQGAHEFPVSGGASLQRQSDDDIDICESFVEIEIYDAKSLTQARVWMILESVRPCASNFKLLTRLCSTCDAGAEGKSQM